MRLTIDKLAKISSATVCFDGITVVAGANNTGKSTVGKALWAMFNAFYNLDARIFDARMRKYLDLLEEYADDLVYDEEIEDLIRRLAKREISIVALREKIEGKLSLNDEELDVDKLMSRINEVSELSDEDIKCQEVLNRIAKVFHSQCASYLFAGTYPIFELEIKKNILRLEVTSGMPKCIFGVRLNHKAFYIDTPDSLLDLRYMSSRRFFLGWGRGSSLSWSLVEGVMEKMREKEDGARQGDSSAVDDLLIKRKFENIEGRLKKLMGGTLAHMKGKGLVFIDDLFPDSPLRLDNLSQGIKAMAMLQVAFMNGTIGDYDILVLDEPEIHLHPKWQIKYAEFIVLLQKTFNLTVLLTSHSPDFVQAIRLYSMKHGVAGRLNGYLSKVAEDGSVTMDLVSDEGWDNIFETFGSGFDELMNLRLELEGVAADA